MKTYLPRISLVGALLAAAARFSGAVPVESYTGVLGDKPPVMVMSGRAFVRFEKGLAAKTRDARIEALGGKVLREFKNIGWTLVALPRGQKVRQGVGVLRTVPDALEVEPNNVYRPNRAPSDPLLESQYALRQVSAFAAWDFSVGNANKTTIAVLDTGIEGTHPDLSGKLVGVSQFFDPDPDDNASRPATAADQPPTAACNHATRVAGVAAAATDNGVGIAGMGWGAQLISLRTFDPADCNDDCTDKGAATCTTTNTSILSALDHAVTLQGGGATGNVIVNISLGEAGAACPAAVQASINAAVAAGVVVVAAAGNDGGAVNAPANCDGVIPVGATDASNAVAGFSSFGAELSNNGLVAPGVALYTTTTNGDYATASGTSFAAPMVAGVAALIKAAKPALTPAQVRDTLRSSADNIGVSALGAKGVAPLGNSSGAGRLNAFRALRLATRGTLNDFEGDKEVIAFPNPFHFPQDGMVTFTIPPEIQGLDANIRVYTLSGRLIRETNDTSWDGKTNDGTIVATGTYFFVVKTAKGSGRGRVTFIR